MTKQTSTSVNPEYKARLTQGPIGRMLFHLTIPMIAGIVSMVIFNLADTYFVGRLGTIQLAALSFTFPVVLIVNSMAIGLGVGAGAVISRALGGKDLSEARRLTTDSLMLAVLVVILFVFIGQLTIRPVFKIMGAGADILPFIEQYMRIWYWGMPFVVVPMVGNNAIRASGDTKTPGIVMIVSSGINIILDPVLIFGLGPFPRLEVAGAALATVFARALTLIFALYLLIYREKLITFEKTALSRIIQSWKLILYIGLPTAGTRVILPVGFGILTRMVAGYGPEAVAGFGVASRVEFFAITSIVALATVLGPFVGQNWGAGNTSRVRKSIHLSYRFSIFYGVFAGIIVILFAKPIAGLFNNDPNVISRTALYLRIVPVAYGLMGIYILSASVLTVLKKPFHAAGLSFFQMFVLCVPLAFAGGHFFQLPGIISALGFSYAVTGIIGYFTLKKILVIEINQHIQQQCAERRHHFTVELP